MGLSVWKWLRVKPEETGESLVCFLYCSITATAQNLIFALSMALFLGHYKSEFLPYIYVGSGIVSLSLGWVVSHFHNVLSFDRFLSRSLWALAASLYLFWGLLLYLTHDWIFLAFAVWASVFFYHSNILVGLLFNRLFTLQQAKRLFGLLGTGQAFGGIIASFILPLFVFLLNPIHVVLITALIFTSLLALFGVIQKRYGKRLAYEDESELEKGPTVSVKKFSNKTYLLLAVLLIVIATCKYCLVDIIFNAEARQTFASEADLASFFGVIYGIAGVCNLGIGLFLFGWVLEKFGLITAFAILPIALGICTVALLSIEVLNGSPLLLFYAVTATWMIHEFLHVSINEEAILLFTQPLVPRERNWLEIQNEATITPVFTALLGLFLIWIDTQFGFHLFTLFCLVGLTCVAGLCVLLPARKAYFKALDDALSKPFMAIESFDRLDKKSAQFLEKLVHSPHPEEIICALKFLEKGEKEGFERKIVDLLESPVPEVELYALSKVEQFKIESAKEKIKTLCSQTKDPQVLEKSLLALGALGVEPSQPSLIVDIKYGTQEKKQEAIRQLSAEKDKKQLASVLNEVEIPSKADLLLSLLADPDPQVRKEASRAAAHTTDSRLYPLLIENLMSNATRSEAAASLLSLGEPLVDYLTSRLNTYSAETKAELLKLLGEVHHPKTIDLLIDCLSHNGLKLLQTTLRSLAAQSIETLKPQQILALRDRLKQECDRMFQLNELDHPENPPLVEDLLERERELCQERIVLLLHCLYPGHSLIHTLKGLGIKREEMMSYATEVLLGVLTKEDKQIYLPLLVEGPIRRGPIQVSLEDHLARFLSACPSWIISSIPSTLAYVAGKQRLLSLAKKISQLGAVEDPYFPETLAWMNKVLNQSS